MSKVSRLKIRQIVFRPAIPPGQKKTQPRLMKPSASVRVELQQRKTKEARNFRVNYNIGYAFRPFLMCCAEKPGVERAGRKDNKQHSYIYFRRSRYDGSLELLHPQSRRPHGHPNAHTEAKLKLIRDRSRRNPNSEPPELWPRPRTKGGCCVESLYRVMRKL